MSFEDSKIKEISLSSVIHVTDMVPRLICFTVLQLLIPNINLKFLFSMCLLFFYSFWTFYPTQKGFPPSKFKNKCIQTFRLSIPFRETFPPPGVKTNSFKLLDYLCFLYALVCQWCYLEWNKI